ncbi:hypothetical protein DFH29DRAFT_307677 [Suillus ampliporus]|nr:hypothetical protein DFH29DRAFT_307677 [Suillus ampliporus]
MINFPYHLAIVDQLTEYQLDEAVAICIKGYVASPSIDHMTGGNKNLQGPLFSAMIKACLLAGEVYVATVIDTGAITGITLWFPPVKALWNSDAQKVLGFNQFLESLSPRTKEWWTDTYGSALEPFLETALSPHTIESSWYLNCICVDPKYQRQGIATNLIRMVEQKRQPPSLRSAQIPVTMRVIEAVINLHPLTIAQVAVYKAHRFQYRGRTLLPTPEHEYMDVHCFTKPGSRA